MNYQLGKKYKIKNKLYIEKLFKYGYWLIEKDIKLIYLTLNFFNINFNFKCAIFVPKKKIKHAVKRNKIKRILKECIRLNKDNAIKKFKKNTIFIIIYKSNIINKFYNLEKQYLNILNKIKN